MIKRRIPKSQHTDLMPFSLRQRIKTFLKIKYGQPIDYPRQFWIETTNECNLRCIMCPQSNGLKREKEMMDMDNFMIIIDQIYLTKPKIMLHMGGEPLLNKNLFAMIEYAKKRGCWTGIHTNATLLTKKMSIRILESALDYISFSFDGFTPEIYEKVRVGARFEQVKSQIETFLDLRQKRNTGYPITRIEILDMEETKKQIRDFIEYWKARKVDMVTTKLAVAWSRLDSSYQMENIITFGHRPCRDIFHKCAILVDGTVVPCCIDVGGQLPLGNIFKQPFKEIWNGDLYSNLRKQHLKNNMPENIICDRCMFRRSWSRGEQITQWFLGKFFWRNHTR